MINEQLAHLEAIYYVIEESIGEIQYTASNKHNMILLALYGTIIENSKSCIILLKEKKYTAIPVILRSVLEVNADLINLIEEESYVDSMTFSYLHQKAQIVKKIINNTPHTRFVEDNLNKFQAELADIERSIEEMRSGGIKKLQIYEKFDKADIDQVYVLYQTLCRESHNNLDRLVHRYIIKDNSNFKITYFRPLDNVDVIQLISFTTRFLINPFRKIQEYFHLKESSTTRKVVELFFQYEEYEKTIFLTINQNLAT